MTLKIITVETDKDIQACFDVLSQLRTEIKEENFLSTVRKQYNRGYQLTSVKSDDGAVVAVAGFHFQENLAWGKHLYIEDLVTDENKRSNGVGHMLLNWLLETARENSCKQLHLDSGIQKKGAHRFYEREGMIFASHHYASKL